MANETELSDREREILRLVATGVSNKEIAQQLVISPNTVKVHLRNIFAKIGVASRTEAALYALQNGIVTALNLPENPSTEEESAPLEPAPITPAQVVKRWWAPASILLVLVIALGLLGWGLGWWDGSGNQQLTPAYLPGELAPRWVEQVELPHAAAGSAAAVYESAVYVIGGETAEGVSGQTLRILNGQANWTSLAKKPTPVMDAQAAVIGERIYVTGGSTADGKPCAALEIYNPRLDRWESGASLPKALTGGALAAMEGRLYLFGGRDGAGVTDAVYVYDPNDNTWQARSALPEARVFASAVVVQNKIFIIGGENDSGLLDRVDVYYPQRDTDNEKPWEVRAALPQARTRSGAALLADAIYLMGGNGADGKELSPLQYSIANDAWQEFETAPQPIGSRPALVTLDTKLHVLGGQSGEAFTAEHQTYQAIYTIMLPVVQQNEATP